MNLPPQCAWKNGNAPSILGAPRNKKPARPWPFNIPRTSVWRTVLAYRVEKFSPLLLFSYSLSISFLKKMFLLCSERVLFWDPLLVCFKNHLCSKTPEKRIRVDDWNNLVFHSHLEFVRFGCLFWFLLLTWCCNVGKKKKKKNVKILYHLWNMYKRDM